MFRDLPRYGEYRTTRMPWCPAVPGHWELVRNKAVMAVKEETVGAQSGDFDLLSLTKAGVIYRDISTGKGKIPASFDTYQVIEEGDLIMCLFDVDETPRTVGRARQHGMITGAYDRFVVKNDVLAEYVNWFYLSVDNTKGLRPLYRGLRKTVPVDQFMASQLPVPPAEEQAAIVKYLAHANARIDKAIAAKRSLLLLLEEQKVSIVRAELGRISGPLVPLKRALKSITAGVWGSAPEESDDEPRWCIRVADFDYVHARIDTSSKTMRSISDADFSKKRLMRGDLLLEGSGGGEKTSVGRVVLFDQDSPAVCSNFLQRLRPAAEINSEFLALVLRDIHSTGAVRPHVKQTTGIQNLDLSTYLATEIPLPPGSVQTKLVTATRRAISEADDVIGRIAIEISLLQEFRTRLVADVVTGQADVRAIASTLPDAPEALDNLIARPDDDLEEALSEGEE